MTKTQKLPGASRRLNRELFPFALLAALGATGDALAQPGYAANVKSWCSSAGRPAPVFTADECSTCHASGSYGTMTAKKSAYLSKNLDAFCPAPKANTAPTLKLSPAGAQTLAVGQTLTITASATDPERDPVALTVESLPTGATFNATTGVFSWTPATGAKGIYTLVFKATDRPSNASQAKTVQQTVTVTVTEPGSANTPPQLDTITTPQHATVSEVLTFQVTAVDADDDELALSASNLPAGAEFKFQGLVNGKWTGDFRWQPSPDQLGQTVTATFTAQEVGTTPAQQDAQDVEFQVGVVSTDTAVKKVTVDNARYRNGKLKLQGKVKFQSRPASVAGLVVNVTDAAGNTLGQATPTRKGDWKLNLPLAAHLAPCRVQAEINGVASASRPVKPMSSACRPGAIVVASATPGTGSGSSDMGSGFAGNGQEGSDYGTGGSQDDASGDDHQGDSGHDDDADGEHGGEQGGNDDADGDHGGGHDGDADDGDSHG